MVLHFSLVRIYLKGKASIYFKASLQNREEFIAFERKAYKTRVGVNENDIINLLMCSCDIFVLSIIFDRNKAIKQHARLTVVHKK